MQDVRDLFLKVGVDISQVQDPAEFIGSYIDGIDQKLQEVSRKKAQLLSDREVLERAYLSLFEGQC